MDECDALIVGARVAGATVAAFLGDAGYRVLLVDRASFPSPALSTHFFRGAGFVSILHDLGVLNTVLALGAPRLIRQYRYVDGAATYTTEPPQEPGEIGFCLSVRRLALDDVVIRRAQASPSVELVERTRVTELMWEGDRVVGVHLACPDGRRTVRARIVIGADGRHSGTARGVAAQNEYWDEPARALYYCYVRGFAPREGEVPDGPEFSLRGDELAYVFPSEEGITCLALSLNLTEYRSLGSTRESRALRFAALLDKHRGLAPRWHASTLEGGWFGTAPEPNYVRIPYGFGWALVGDASLHQDPWKGFGMDCAGVHAQMLAESLIAWWRGEMAEVEALATYHLRRNEHGLQRYRFSVDMARDLHKLIQG